MKKPRYITYKNLTRAVYFLGIVFLLTGMLLSMVSQPAAASSSAKPTRIVDPVIRTPEGLQPTFQPTPPAHNPDNPGVPGRRVPGRNIQDFNFSKPSDPSDSLRIPLPPVRLLALSSGSVQFVQSNYCLSQPGPGWVEATAIVSLPEGETAILQTDWYIVHPDPYSPNPGYNDHHYNSISVTSGQQVTWNAYWPGASLWNPNDPEYATIEIHWGAQILDTDGNPVGSPGSLDAFFNGGCGNRLNLEVSHQCAVGGGIEWSVYNPGTTPVNFSYSITDGTAGNGRVPANESTTFAVTAGGAYTATVTYDDGQGAPTTASDTSGAGECTPISALNISHACSPNGIVFTASNPNSMPVTFDYTDGATSGSTTAPANGSIDFLTLPTGVAHTVTITWPDGVGGTGTDSDSSTAEECGPVTLVISHQCKDGGGIIWNVYNPGTQTVSFTWILDNDTTQTGSGSVGAGQTVMATETSGGAHRLDVSWTGGSAFDTSTIGECGGTPVAALAISRQCTEGGGIQWSVTNTGDAPAAFTWTLDTDASSGSGNVGVGQTVVVTTSTGGAHLLVVTWNGNSISDQSGPQECGGTDTLAISFQCVTGGGIQWRVTNSSATALDFNWNLDNGAQTGSGSAPASGSVDVVVSTGGVHSFSITWSGGSASRSSTAEDCNPQPIILKLEWQCSADNTGVDWVVINENPVEVSFTWSLDGGTSTSDTVAPNASKIFHTVNGHDSHTMSISWADEIGSYTLTDTNSPNVCVLPEEPVLTLSNRCVMDNRIQWSAANPGNSDVNFEWDLDNGAQTGSDTAPAGGRAAFLVTTNGHHTVTITWPENNSLTRTSSHNRCVPIVQTEPAPPGATGVPGVGTAPTSGIPRTGGTPVPTLSVPGSGAGGGSDSAANSGQGVAVSPVTGGDLNALTPAGLVQRLFTNLGLLFLGLALALTGFGARLKQ